MSLPDPSGQSATFVSGEGQQSWQIQFDPLGNVIANTLPMTLVEPLAGDLGAATGLQFLAPGLDTAFDVAHIGIGIREVVNVAI